MVARRRNLAVRKPRNPSRLFRRRINYGYEVRAQLRLRNSLELILFSRLQTLIRKFVMIQAEDFSNNQLFLTRAEKQFLEDLKLLMGSHYKRVFMAMYERNSMVYRNLEKKQDDPFDFSNVNFERLVGGYIASNTLRLEGISRTLANKIKDYIEKGAEEGKGPREIARSLRKVAPTLSRTRALTIARTETSNAASWANHKYHVDLGDELGIDFWKRWVAVSDGRTRPEHREANGQTVPMDGKFKLSHPKEGMVEMDRVGDPSGGVYHIINCRCVITYAENPEDLL